VPHEDGYTRLVREFDAWEYKLKETYSGCAPETNATPQRVLVYDAEGREVEQRYLDAHGNPARDPVNGYQKLVTAYNAEGEAIRYVFSGYDAAKGLAPTMIVDLRGDRVYEYRFEDEDGAPAHHANGYSRSREVRDEGFRILEEVRWGFGPSYGYDRVEIKHEYPEAGGHLIVETYLDSEGTPISTPSLCGRIEKTFDARERLTKQVSIGYDGSKGYYRWILETTYDEDGSVTNERFEDAEGRPCARDDGAARFVVRKDDQGRAREVAIYDAEGRRRAVRVVVRRVVPGGPAEAIGIRPGDVFADYDGRPVESTIHLIQGRASEDPGSGDHELGVLRDGRRLAFPVRPGLLQAELDDEAGPPLETPVGGDEGDEADRE
jgi:hypothetical protein